MNTLSKSASLNGTAARPKIGLVARLAAVAIILAVLAYLAVSTVAADRLSHPDRKPVTGTPADYGLKYERVSFRSAIDNIRLEGWYIDSPGSKVIVMLHGRNGVRNDADGTALKITRSLVEHNYDVFMFDFRAHGESAGDRYSFGELEVRDVAGALNYLKSRGVTEVGAIGFSMGASTELNAAPDYPEMRAIISDSAFADAGSILELHLKDAAGLPSFVAPGVMLMGRMYGVDLAKNRPQRQVTRLGNRPLLLIHGTEDELIPVSHAYVLKEAAEGNPNATLWIVPGACHTCAYNVDNALYMERIIGFFDKHL
jgi:pimeloyl-ACP methyl ester carboxylesterase